MVVGYVNYYLKLVTDNGPIAEKAWFCNKADLLSSAWELCLTRTLTKGH